MKPTFSSIITSSILVACLGMSTANAQSSASAEDVKMANEFMQTAQAFVQSAVGGDGNVRVILQGDTATLIGYVNTKVTKRLAEKAALKDSRVNKVHNRIIVN
ncbi:MAG: BON domain-containing protein [Granulosicoccus sp.]